jgi:hypothetical protein
MGRGPRAPLQKAALAVVLASAAGCAAIAGLHDRIGEASDGGDVNAAETGSPEGGDATLVDSTVPVEASHPDGGGDSAGPVDAADAGCRDPGACCVIYVSADGGNDTHTGCVTSMPLRTIGRAMTVALGVADGGVPPTIEVCAGTYVEAPLTIAVPLVLRGGFDCIAWNQPPNYGYPTFSANPTVIQFAGDLGLAGDGGAQVATVTVGPWNGGVTPSPAIDGFIIQGPGTPDGGNPQVSIGLLVQGAAPAISNVHVVGGFGTGDSYAIQVSKASPSINADLVDFLPTVQGVGTSIGIYVVGNGTSGVGGARLPLVTSRHPRERHPGREWHVLWRRGVGCPRGRTVQRGGGVDPA